MGQSQRISTIGPTDISTPSPKGGGVLSPMRVHRVPLEGCLVQQEHDMKNDKTLAFHRANYDAAVRADKQAR